MELNDVSKELVKMAAYIEASNNLPDDSSEPMVAEMKQIALMLRELGAANKE
jgi:hypothetical protein